MPTEYFQPDSGRDHDRSRGDWARESRSAVCGHDSPLQFLGAFAREPLKVGACWPSSKRLSRVVVDSCEIKPGATIVELGPGTGSFTSLLLERLNGSGRLVAVEINATHANILRRRFPRCEVIQDTAENLHRHLNGRKTGCVVSGLAWGNMLPRTQDGILRAVLESLSSRGQFVAFAYVHAAWFPTALRFRRRLAGLFERVETTPIVWRNLPPAFVFRCRRA
jgi:phosphatidylethanolamine/phosphatidyl-N-methylethanolamine N-methyltransferase